MPLLTVGNEGISDHGLLAGILDDDHTQYLLIAGTRAMTGNLLMGDNSITGIDTITFTDVNGTIAGIENQNLVDKTATESITGDWTFSDDVMIDGSSDEIQLIIQGHSIQTNDILVIEQSDGTDVFTVANDGETTIGVGGAGDSVIAWRVNDSTVYIEGVDDSDSDKYKIAGATGLGNDDLLDLDTSGNLTIIGNFYSGGLIVPSGTTPSPAIEGALFLDTDAGANGTLKCYSNGAWRDVTVF